MSLFDGDVVVLNDDLQSRIYDRCLYMLRSVMCTFPRFDVCAYSLMDQLCCVCFKSERYTFVCVLDNAYVAF